VVFSRMAEEMLFLANQGVEVLRLDAVAFLWKKLGTSCENLPQAHKIIQAFNLLIRITAPALVFKSEAIVHPDEVARYIAPDECQLSYNPNLMALLWESLATREVNLLGHSMKKRFSIPTECAWVNYVRCHDDIGWTFSNEDAEEIGIRAHDHRRFLIDFYTGRHEASFSAGLPFQENHETGDARISGTAASLAGLERAIRNSNAHDAQIAVRRLLLIHGVIFTLGGIPLVYSGDELAALNDHAFERDDEKAGDSRWVHRPVFNWETADLRRDAATYQGRIHNGILRLVWLRQNNLAFTRSETEIVDSGSRHVFAYFRHHPDQTLLMLANFSDSEQSISGARLRQLGLRRTVTDLMAGQVVLAARSLEMAPCQFMVLSGSRGG
jgi:amylosucrase